MFIDRTRVKASAGAGGNGCCSFRREKHVPRGGPDGGDGGQGGSIYFVGCAGLNSLESVRYHYHWRGERGVHGQGSQRHGRNGSDTLVEVPLGTLVRDVEGGTILADLTDAGQRFRAARGGQGGRGNARFATNANRAPRFAERGEPGEEREYLLELKLIAAVGLVGLPNAGKSTLLRQISAARPKVADYPFTTLHPHLGMAGLSDHRTLAVADIPGIIEGAADGKGLGHDFLRHIERTEVLLFLLDLGGEDPAAAYAALTRELAAHSAVLAERPRMVALNKADVPENAARVAALRETFPEAFVISAATGAGTPALLEALYARVEQVRAEREAEEEAAVDVPVERHYTYEPPFALEAAPGGFVVSGARVERVVRMTDFDNEYALAHLHDCLRKMGLFRALKTMGAQAGQSITIGGVELEYFPED